MNNPTTKRKVACVTGATRGIGRAIACCLAGHGFSVIVSGRDVDGAATTCKAIEDCQGIAISCLGDITDHEMISRIFDDAETVFHAPVSVLVNNAGICPRVKLGDISSVDCMRAFNTNSIAPLLLIQEMNRRLNGESGAIINISSLAAIHPCARWHHYVASKAALAGMTRSLALELAPQIRVNAIAPGFVATEDHKTTLAKQIEQTPLRRLVELDEVTDAVLFLVNNNAITGTTLIIDNGWSLNHE